jgi:hypothetical protein
MTQKTQSPTQSGKESSDTEELAKLRQMIKDYVPYVLATLPYGSKHVVNTTVKCVTEEGASAEDYAAVHFGRAVSSRNQLEALLKRAKGDS